MNANSIAPRAARRSMEAGQAPARHDDGRASLPVRPLRLRSGVTALALGLLALASLPAISAQAYPARPVRILLPLTSGGNMDTIARLVAQKLSDSIGQQVIVDNRPGAGSRVALEILHGAVPDGHTIMAMSLTPIIHPLLYKSRFELLRDFAPVGQMSAQGYMLIVNNAVPAKSVAELIQHLKANPGKLSFMSTGIGSPIHLTGELFQATTGTRMLHVPYKGAAYQDIVSGLVQIAFPAIPSAIAYVQGGRLRPIAVTTPKRTPALPDVPTLTESGVEGVAVVNWYGIIAPKDTPRALITQISKMIASAIQSPELAKRLRADGTDAVGSTPAEFAAHIRAETERWSKVIKQASIRAE
jgi:tripartite-type tricarboxylate transporter receptor subunit TctC